MFREVRKIKNRITKEEAIDVLRTQVRGVLSVQGDDGYPYGVPINYYYREEDGCLYFHGGRIGYRVEAIQKCDKVSFCVYDSGYHKAGDWALTIRSAIVFGRAEIIDDLDEVIAVSRELCAHFPVSQEEIDEEIRKSAKATLCFRIVPEHITGKQIREA